MTWRLSPISFPLLRLVALLIALAAIPAQAQFETRTTQSTAPYYGAFSIATGDFNEDGRLDVAIVYDGGFTVSLGNGDGTFGQPTPYNDTDTAIIDFIAVGDFNNDGKIDLVTANGYNSVSVYLGNGDGTFQSPITTTTNEYCNFVIPADFNGDGKLDVAVIDNPYISILIGNGDGTFQTPIDNNSFVGAEWLAVGDFNNDHKLDLLAAGVFGSSYNLGTLLGNGDGTLQDSITYPLQYVPFGLAAGQIDNSGNLGAVVGYLGSISVLRGNGDGSFQPQVYYSTTGTGGGPVVLGQLNRDGNLDIATLGSVPGVDIFWGKGDGSFEAAQFFASGVDGLPAIGDLNGDGLPDIAMASEEYGITTMLNTGNVSFSPSSAPVSFPVQLIGTSSQQQAVKLSNRGKVPLTIRSVKLSGPFQMSNKCEGSVAAGASCSIGIEYKPKTAGTQAGTITIADSASSKPQFVSLSGSATAVEVSPLSLSFGNQKVGFKSKAQVVTATNEGQSVITFDSVSIGGADPKDFSEVDSCSFHTIRPGASCEITVTFTPKTTGARSGTIYLNTPQGTTGPAPVQMSGNGT
jgi:FG-GAP-like repeat/Abnormal spindle-like microcephaly-assoc'd, ASPM-SPD-2-Hydin